MINQTVTLLKQVTGRIACAFRTILTTLRYVRIAQIVRRSGAFDSPWYRATYPDSSGWDPIIHYFARGAAQGHLPHALFDPEWWRETRQHARHRDPFVDYVLAPERWNLAPSPYLKVDDAIDPYPKLGPSSPLSLYRHGGSHLRPSPLFDVEFYKRQNPDVMDAGFDPLLHFITNGGREGRSPCASFDAFWYLEKNLDVRAEGAEPLRHFLMRGARQGRAPHRAIELRLLLQRAPGYDPAGALMLYQAEQRHRLDAFTHRHLPPPGARAALFDDWPWRKPPIPAASGRRLIIIAGEKNADLDQRIGALANSTNCKNCWLVAMDSAAAEAATKAKFPILDLSDEPVDTLNALLRAGFAADPWINISTDIGDGHPVHKLLADTPITCMPRPGVSPIGATDICRVHSVQKHPHLKISVIVPSFQHASYLNARLASIVAQRLPPSEIIIIDDASQDQSMQQIREFADQAQLPVRVVARELNSGSPFSAWIDGATLASGALVWIAESDDLADTRFLERLAPYFDRDPSMMLAYCQSGIIGTRGESYANDHLFYTDSLNEERWEKSYRVAGSEEIRQALAIKNTIPNVSAALIRRTALIEACEGLSKYRYCGDWLAYARLATQGNIGFHPETLAQTRRHRHTTTAEGERDMIAIREAQRIRQMLWERSECQTDTIIAGYAQHELEVDSRRTRHRLARAAFRDEPSFSEFRASVEALMTKHHNE